MSFTINTCSECNETIEDEFETCLDCGKQNICSYCIRTLSQDGNSYRGCIECSDKETEMEEERKLRRRKTVKNKRKFRKNNNKTKNNKMKNRRQTRKHK